MAKNIRRIFAMIMVVAMFVSVLPMQTLAAETVHTTETSPEGLPTNVATTTDKQTDADGNTTVTVTIQKDTEGTLSDGSELERHETKTETEDETGKTGVKEGNETITSIIPDVNTTVAVPDQVGEEHANSKEFGDSSSVTDGDKKEGEDDAEYNQTTTTETPGKVTITTTGKEYSQEFTDRNGLEYTNSDATPNDSNDLHYVGEAPEEFLPGYEGEAVIPEGVPGYDYTYVGSGNTSILTPAVVFDTPLDREGKIAMYGDNAYINIGLSKSYFNYYMKWLDADEKASIAYDESGNYVTDEEGYLLNKDGERIVKGERTAKDPDGNTTYLHRFDNYGDDLKVEGWYEDGEWVKELNGKDGYYAVWAGPQQFLLVDSNGNIITTYCADQTNPTEDGYGYNIENLEDATYYSEEEAARIRSIAKNGYWGVAGEEEGSLEYMKQQLLAAGFTEEELASLTDGVALTATQMAIWSCSNKMAGVQFVNAHYDKSGPDDGNGRGDGWGPNVLDYKGQSYNGGKVPTDKEDEIKLMFKIYTYLTNLEGTEVEGTMADTVITAENAIQDMNVTVIKKAEDHDNNKDDDKENDAYVTDVSFALVVEPTGDDEESLKVTLVTSDGQTIVGRICGEKEDDDEVMLEKEGENYWFRNIVLTEGGQTFTLNLEGVQNLDQGVYLYSSEVREGNSSQTLVGKAGGIRDFDVTIDLKFDLDVEDNVVVKEHIWRDEYEPVDPPAETPEDPEDEELVPPPIYRLDPDAEEEIPEEPVPLAAPVVTGSNSYLWILVVMMAVCGIVVINVSGKKNYAA